MGAGASISPFHSAHGQLPSTFRVGLLPLSITRLETLSQVCPEASLLAECFLGGVKLA